MLGAYPIGSIYLSVNDTSPASLFGGTWEKIQDRFLLASGSSYSLGATGGEATHTLSKAELPEHSHYLVSGSGARGNSYIQMDSTASTYDGNYIVHTGKVGWIGADCGNQPHNNMPPYLAVNVWKRIS
mgnify:CR=1 FL=1